MYVERALQERFSKLKIVTPVIALVGARQAGKTTFLKHQGGRYLLFDDPDIRELFETDVKKFEQQYLNQHITILDEIQYCADAGPKLKYLADSGHQLWITSSSEVILSKDVLSYLVGRVSILKLYPFSFAEFLRAKQQNALITTVEERFVWEHATYGGYPKIVLAQDKDVKEIVLKDLHETMLLKDVVRTFAISDIRSLEKTSRFLANNIGSVLSYQSMTNTLGIAYVTMKKYLDALEKSHLIVRVPPYFQNKNKELSKQPKVYFVDTGMRNAIMNTFPNTLDGGLFENYVFSELLKAGFSPKFWRTKAGAEVDFILERGKELIPIECKLSFASVERSLMSFIETYRPSRAFVVYAKGTTHTKKINGCSVTICGVRKLIEKLSNEKNVDC